GVEAALRAVLADGRLPQPAQPSFDAAASMDAWEEVLAGPSPSPAPATPSGRVDVIVVRRDPQQALDRCLAALEQQRYRDFAVTVSEGSSVATARQQTLEQGSAPYVLFLDADDLADPELLATLVRARHASSADAVGCGVRV